MSKSDKLFHKRGFTFIEVSIVIGIILLVGGVVSFYFSQLNKSQSLDKDALSALSVLNEARSSAMSAKDFSDYGVHFTSNSYTFFKGSVFVYNDANNVTYNEDDSISISSIALGGGSDVVFKKVTGETDDNGSLIFSLTNDPTKYQTITIFATGATEKN